MSIFTSCSPKNNTQYNSFSIQKYKGYKVMGKTIEYNEDWDWYVLKNDTTVELVRVPSWFGKVYSIGDSIK
jgi:hypothetical protein